MRILWALLIFIPLEAYALDVCPAYAPIHEKEILPRIKSGIPFKLLSLAADRKTPHRRIVRLEYDLWDETLLIEIIGRSKSKSTLKDAQGEICKALSIPEGEKGQVYTYRLMLNPVLGEGLTKLKEKGEESQGLLEINWDRLAKDLETEKTLIESELKG